MAALKLEPFEPASLRRTGGGLLHHWHRGTMLPPFLHPPAIEELRGSWDSGPEDLLICTAQKVGTHLAKKFVVEVLAALAHLPADHPCADGDIGHGAIPWPEVLISQEGPEGWQRALARSGAGPRIWYTHAPYGDLPLRSIHPRSRFLVVHRDPRDALVSQFFFYRNHPHLGADERHTLPAYGEDFLAGRTYFGDYHAHLRGWLRRRDGRLREEQLLVLSFEAMVRDKPTVLRRLAAFLAPDRELTPQQQAAIAARTEFEAMKRQLSAEPRSFHFPPERFFRAGSVGDWRNHLEPALAVRVEGRRQRLWGPLRLATA